MNTTSSETGQVFKNKYASVQFLDDKKTILCQTISEYIPIQYFQELFEQITEFLKHNHVEKFIFDKRSLRVFHQPSMEWYHTIWKKEALRYGLRVYRKILPQDKLFRTSVKIGREKILKEHPEFNINQYDIQYCETIAEAIVN